MADFPFSVEDVEYRREGGKPLLATAFVPEGPGPYPAIVELHGGSWAAFDRTRNRAMHEALARSGVSVVALDYRKGAEHPWPAASADANYGVRWVKANAKRFKTRPDLVGISGNSSGGHSAILTAMRPLDPLQSSIALPGAPALDASVRCVVLLWPVLNPLGRYRNAQRAAARKPPADFGARVMKNHEDYFGDERNMLEASVVRLLAGGARVSLPPVLFIQSSRDEIHNFHNPDTGFPGTEADLFADLYRKAGGELDLVYYDAPVSFMTVNPDLAESKDALARILEFVHRRIAVER
jgi:acetyl esterase/lipase